MVGKGEYRKYNRKKFHKWAVPCTQSPHRGEGTRESRSKPLSHSHPTDKQGRGKSQQIIKIGEISCVLCSGRENRTGI
jgi:hypothetical protein